MKKRNFTLIELLFVILILITLIGISWVAVTKVIRTQNIFKAKGEMSMLSLATVQYKDRYGVYPFDVNEIPEDGDQIEIDFFNELELITRDDATKNLFYNNGEGAVNDPYEQPYYIKRVSKGKYIVVSISDLLEGANEQ
jgi:type II secretory pathway pseudopilin PulG